LSFRNRLILFFVVIVIVPMIAVAVVLFRLISDSQSGKADAAVAARAQTATRVYEQDAGNPAAARAAARVATDRVLGQALRAGRPARARRRAQQLVTSGHAIRIVLMRGGQRPYWTPDRPAPWLRLHATSCRWTCGPSVALWCR